MERSEDTRESRSEHSRARAGIIDWVPALIGLVALAVIQEAGLFGSGDRWKLFWSLVNLAPALWIVRAVTRALQRSDEYQRRRQLEAMALAFGVIMMAIFTVGLLHAAGVGDLSQLMQISFIGSMLVWVGAQLWFRTQRAR